MKRNDKVRVNIPGSLFHGCIGYVIKTKNKDDFRYCLQIEEFGENVGKRQAQVIMSKPLIERNYWFAEHELVVIQSEPRTAAGSLD